MSKELTQATFQPVATRLTKLGVDEVKIKKEIGYALALLNANSYLASSDQSSIFASIIHAANTGLTLNPTMKRAALVPRFIRGVGKVCSFEPMYQGLIYLAVKEGAATAFNCQVVHEKDKFLAQPANNQNPVIHEFNAFDRGEAVGVYCIATLLDGNKQAEFMSVQDINKIRDRSEAYQSFKSNKTKSTPWSSDWEEMSKKTVLKRLVKRLPMGKTESNLYKVIDLDNSQYTVEPVEIEQPADDSEVLRKSLREALISMEPEEAEGYRNLLNEKREAGELTDDLMRNILNDIKAPQNA